MQTLLEEIDQQITEQFFTDTLGQLFTDTFTPVTLLSMQRATARVRLEECGCEAGSNSLNYETP